MTRVIVAMLITASLFGVPLEAAAKGPRTGPIIIKDAPCQKKLVQKCHWEGNRHICVWVESNECEIY